MGTALKRPAAPVWVCYMESHYSTVFALAPAGPPDDGSAFDLYYYDGLANQDELIRLTVRPSVLADKEADYDLVPPLDETLRTRWPEASIDWNDTEPLL